MPKYCKYCGKELELDFNFDLGFSSPNNTSYKECNCETKQKIKKLKEKIHELEIKKKALHEEQYHLKCDLNDLEYNATKYI
ncbi:MAG: hypothetical protein E7167_02170 [Firmicutes bacterium]|nr:hypothetical protein [Bacillota bacterium]